MAIHPEFMTRGPAIDIVTTGSIHLSRNESVTAAIIAPGRLTRKGNLGSINLRWQMFRIALILTACLVMEHRLSAQTKLFYVSTNGNDRNTGTSITSAWRTLGKAVTNLTAGQTVFVAPGLYNECNLHFQHSGQSNAYVNVLAWSNVPPVITNAGAPTLDLNGMSYVQVSGICFSNAFQGIVNSSLTQCSHIIIASNQFVNLDSSAINLTHVSSSTVQGNLADNTVNKSYGECITFSQCEYLDIACNEVKNSTTSKLGGEGIDVKGSKHIRVYGNKVHDMNSNQCPAIYLDAYDGPNSDIQAFNNITRNCNAGIIVSSELGNPVDHIHVFNNQIIDCIECNAGIVHWGPDYDVNQVLFENNTIVQTVLHTNPLFPVAFTFHNAGQTNVTAQNNILYNFQSNSLFSLGSNVSNLLKGYNLSNHGTTNILGAGSLVAEPIFVNFATKDFGLNSNSPAIKAGTSNGVSFDAAFHSRSVNRQCDLGAYGYGSTNVVALPSLLKPPCIALTNSIADAGSDGFESNGVVFLSTASLPMVNSLNANNGFQTLAALRFNHVNIPAGAVVSSAWITLSFFSTFNQYFQETNGTLCLYAERTNNSPGLTSTYGNLSSRNPTYNKVIWLPQYGWVGSQVQTPWLDQILNEIVTRGDWSKGNAITFLFKTVYPNTNQLAFNSFNANTNLSAHLYLEYTMPRPSLVIANAPTANGAPGGISTNSYDYNSLVSLTAPISTNANAGLQYVASGWTGSGNVTAGAGSTASFSLTTNSSLNWSWRTNAWVNFWILEQ